MREKELPGIRETTEDFDGIEKEILKMFRREIYLPLTKELGARMLLKNAVSDIDKLLSHISSGKIRYSRGKFRGLFEAATSKALKKLGAVWDDGAFSLPTSKLSYEIRTAIQSAEYRLDRAFDAIDKRLSEALPTELAAKVQIGRYFDRTLYRLDRDFEAQVKGITVVPKLTPETRAKVAEGYTKDLQRYIEDFTRKQILELRKDIQASTLEGNRYESVISKIEKSYGVSQRKAKFLARQETALMMASFKKVRYQEAGIKKYRWQTVIGSPAHPVRPFHKDLNGKVFDWNHPPITDAEGHRNHPGQDYNCRCIARPILAF